MKLREKYYMRQNIFNITFLSYTFKIPQLLKINIINDIR